MHETLVCQYFTLRVEDDEMFSDFGKLEVEMKKIPKLDLRCYIVKLRIQGCRYWV